MHKNDNFAKDDIFENINENEYNELFMLYSFVYTVIQVHLNIIKNLEWFSYDFTLIILYAAYNMHIKKWSEFFMLKLHVMRRDI